MKNKIIAYKVFNSDWTCSGFKYEIGKTFRLEDSNGNLIKPIKCEKGFHACLKVNQCFNYYNFNINNKIALVELSGDIVEDNDKIVSNIITIIEEISWEKMLTLANTGVGNSGHSNSGHRNSGHWNSGHWNSGHWNSGHWNSGHWNSGHRNSGHWNSGDWNSGDRNSGHWNSGHWNSGDWNSGDRNSGFFNSKTPNYVLVFNKECPREIWDNCKKPNFIYDIYLNKWISESEMTDKEKIDNPKFYVTQGYLKTFTYQEAWKNAYVEANAEDIELLKNLPNFDSEVFEEITGIKL